MTKFAAAAPGKMGDVLYCLPVMRYIYKATGLKFDFWTSEYCAPLKDLFEYQECVDKFYVAPDYKLERMDMGCQPYEVPVPIQQYARTYQLGFRSVPDEMLHQFIGRYAGVDVPLAIEYDYPPLLDYTWPSPYIVLAPRGKTTFEHIFNEIADKTIAIIVGGKDDYTGHGVDLTGLDMLDTLTILSGAKAFVGLMSSQLVLANGFDIPRIALNGYMADMRHSIITARNYYPGPNTSADDIIALFDK
jgi:ADP-heptose:LPS heptosyltransferase